MKCEGWGFPRPLLFVVELNLETVFGRFLRYQFFDDYILIDSVHDRRFGDIATGRIARFCRSMAALRLAHPHNRALHPVQLPFLG